MKSLFPSCNLYKFILYTALVAIISFANITFIINDIIAVEESGLNKLASGDIFADDDAVWNSSNQQAANAEVEVEVEVEGNSTLIVPPNDSNAPGFGACMLVLDDTIRLHEWIAYHYTFLPLTSLVLAYDPKSSDNSIKVYHQLAQIWKDAGVNITVLESDAVKQYNITHKRRRRPELITRQLKFVSACTHHYLDKNREKFILHTDSDEFLAFNFVQPGENISHFDHEHSVWQKPLGVNGKPTWKQRYEDRVKALPIRKSLEKAFEQNATLLSFIEEQRAQDGSNKSYFPSENGCTRIVGLYYGNTAINGTKKNILTTKKYPFHNNKFPDTFSKVMLDISKIDQDRKLLQRMETIHNPFIDFCGRNGLRSTGKDFMGSVLKLSHCVGTLESWLERNTDTRGTHDASIEGWHEKSKTNGPYNDIPDMKMGKWVDIFIAKVGGQHFADKLLFNPLAESIERVRGDIFDSLASGAVI